MLDEQTVDADVESDRERVQVSVHARSLSRSTLFVPTSSRNGSVRRG
jgi:hypothetical protein